ncbi:unnamed protein product [Chironomus riparius]|uniref:tRNA-splicing endonuclease subunit Sen54 N-terminal domain-containing protein n=1 Tax=Chironomus riparius TaxID=315576 RepID=A0A9N9RXB8_9DIPT|nr:unnamed protein product [Chironomus riparius]
MSKIIKEGILLNGQQIFEANKKLEEYSILGKGSKEKQNEVFTAEDRQSDSTIESLYNLLKIERVYLTNKRSKGIYEKEKNRVKIMSIVGKLGVIGFFEDEQMYLKPHEALLLIEMNRLEVTYDTVTISVEQAYSIFLTSKCELSLEDYIVYSYISRIGYIIIIHDPEVDKEKFKLLEERKKVSKEDEMIWCILMQKLNMPYSKETIESNYDLYVKTKSDMDKSAAIISGQDTDNDNMEVDNAKHDNSNEPPNKKFKPNALEEDNNFLDILKTELEYLSYRQIFNKFSYVTRKTFSEFEYDKVRNLKFTFDVFLPKMHFKRTEHLSNYRIIVLRSNEEFPSNVELQRLRENQSYEVPIIIAVVSESLSVHFSICTFK